MARRKSKVGSGVAEVLAKRVWHEDDARVALRAWDESGLNAKSFAEMYGFSRDRLPWWRKKLSWNRGAEKSRPALLPVRVVAPPTAVMSNTPTPARRLADSGVELVVGARQVRVAPGFDAETLARVVGVLEVMPC